MRISVIAVLPAQEPLRESAEAAIAGRPAAIPLEATNVPPNFQIDPTFSAVAVGTGNPADTSLASLDAQQSDNFVVRGFVEADTPEQVPAIVDGRPIYSDPEIAPFPTCGGSPSVGGIVDVEAGLQLPAMHGRGLDGDGVAVAVMDTGINLSYLSGKLRRMPRFDAFNSWTPPGGLTSPGTHAIGHGTMCAFDALIGAPKATLLDYPILSSSSPGGAMTGRTLSIAIQAYAKLLAFWAVAFAGPHYKGMVVTNSWGIYHPSWDFPAGHPGRYIDNPNHPFTLLVGVLAQSGADIVFAAGNCGASCPSPRCQGLTSGTIMGANASRDVLTLGGCDTTKQWVGYSSQGPSIRGMSQEKPDVATYTHFLGSEVSGVGSPDTGTSTACPVAAGCMAAIRTRLSPTAVSPAALFAQVRALAAGPPGIAGPGWNPDYGYGLLDPNAAAMAFGV